MDMGHAELIWRVYIDAVHRDGIESIDGLKDSSFWLDHKVRAADLVLLAAWAFVD
jgi:hypothetical protein